MFSKLSTYKVTWKITPSNDFQQNLLYTQHNFNMNIFQKIFVVINFSPCDAFQSLNDLEKTASSYDLFRATGIGRYH